ncbi:hypothetical protein DM01DRAFT_1336203 [Hesseltinella vesiculosa]|uniref:Uncharacterized protein n=1 Tax=Hesseltinella vesiculosa TaxID=101127 RepID=A0A1X2GHH2_9FUNG|nr:hypothetical protein DM01DRAFT_1336203 [Hesseltinella vesiculosa]
MGAISQKRTRVEGAIHKRIPQRPPATITDIYFSHKSRPSVLVKRIKQLMIGERHPQLTLHGLGAVILPTINTAQAAKSAMNNQVDLKFTTSTERMIDDIEPEDMVSEQ